jgi:hypothetical protein
MSNVLSYLTTLKEFVGGKKLCEVPSPEDIEVNKIQIYYDALAKRIKQGYVDNQRNLLSRLADVEDCRQTSRFLKNPGHGAKALRALSLPGKQCIRGFGFQGLIFSGWAGKQPFTNSESLNR